VFLLPFIRGVLYRAPVVSASVCVCVYVCEREGERQKSNTKDTVLLLLLVVVVQLVREAQAFCLTHLCNNNEADATVVLDSTILSATKIAFRVRIRVLIFIIQLWHECLWL
jgi:hypothetical protein